MIIRTLLLAKLRQQLKKSIFQDFIVEKTVKYIQGGPKKVYDVI